MEIFKYICKFKGLLCLLVTLLIFSMAFTFVLPFWQAKIVNIGLVQDGIEYVAPQKISKKTAEKLSVLNQDIANLQIYYEVDSQNNFVINDAGKNNISEINQYLTNPLAYIKYSQENDSEIQIDKFNEYISNNEPGIIQQTAIKACKDEMESLGINIFNIQLNYILGQGSLMLLFIVLACIIGYCINLINTKISMSIAYEKRSELFKSILNFTNYELNKFGEASLMTRCTNDIALIQNFASMVLSTLLTAPISIVVGFIFAYMTAPQLSWIIIVAAVAILIAAIISVKILTPTFFKIQNLLDWINLISRYILSGFFTIKTWNREKFAQDKFNEANHPLYERQLFIGKLLSVVNPLLILGTNAIAVLILILGGIYINYGTMQVGDLIAFSSYSLIIISYFTSLGMFIGSLPRCSVAIQRIEDVINTKSSINIKTNNNSLINIDKEKEFNISLKNIFYSYNDNSNYEIKDINLEIKNGQTLAIVGETGSGKTTLLQVIMNLIKPTKGTVLLNNKNVANIKTKQYYSLFAYAPQESFLFSGNLKDNILYSQNYKEKTQDIEFLNKIIHNAQLESFIKNKKAKVDLQISQDAINISGGQKQRISIARALASQRPILVLDDCFTSLDYKVEGKIIDSIYKDYKNFTKIIASSRISNIMQADNIICMFKGQIVGSGNFNTLIKTCPEFVKIVKSQKQHLDINFGSDDN